MSENEPESFRLKKYYSYQIAPNELGDWRSHLLEVEGKGLFQSFLNSILKLSYFLQGTRAKIVERELSRCWFHPNYERDGSYTQLPCNLLKELEKKGRIKDRYYQGCEKGAGFLNDIFVVRETVDHLKNKFNLQVEGKLEEDEHRSGKELASSEAYLLKSGLFKGDSIDITLEMKEIYNSTFASNGSITTVMVSNHMPELKETMCFILGDTVENLTRYR